MMVSLFKASYYSLLSPGSTLMKGHGQLIGSSCGVLGYLFLLYLIRQVWLFSCLSQKNLVGNRDTSLSSFLYRQETAAKIPNSQLISLLYSTGQKVPFSFSVTILVLSLKFTALNVIAPLLFMYFLLKSHTLSLLILTNLIHKNRLIHFLEDPGVFTLILFQSELFCLEQVLSQVIWQREC